jgi:uncharacterized membrane protein
MGFNIKLTIIIFIIAIVIDLLWLGIFANKFYKSELKDLYTKKVNLMSAILVYLIMALGITFFVIGHPLVNDYKTAFYVGAFFGFTMYAIFDLTNLAVIKNYPLKLTVIDIIWGTLLCGFLGIAGRYFN